ncbi:hypothetical protein [Maridesulfovibrio sp.]|uniref:hypothetical protein n=1 Tax=Maridesulfovibrio sp. TaxID=2795000 RepID=UPI003BA847C2
MNSKENQKSIKKYLKGFFFLFLGFAFSLLILSSSAISTKLYNSIFYMVITGLFTILLSFILNQAKIKEIIAEGVASVKEKEEIINKLRIENDQLKEKINALKKNPEVYEHTLDELQVCKAKIESLELSIQEKDGIIKNQNWRVWFTPCCKAIADTVKENALKLGYGNEVKIKRIDFYHRVAAHHPGSETFDSASKKAWDLLPDSVKIK